MFFVQLDEDISVPQAGIALQLARLFLSLEIEAVRPHYIAVWIGDAALESLAVSCAFQIGN